MPCVMCGHWVNQECLGEAIQDVCSGWYYFCHSACRRWLKNLNSTLAYYGAPSDDEIEVDAKKLSTYQFQ